MLFRFYLKVTSLYWNKPTLWHFNISDDRGKRKLSSLVHFIVSSLKDKQARLAVNNTAGSDELWKEKNDTCFSIAGRRCGRVRSAIGGWRLVAEAWSGRLETGLFVWWRIHQEIRRSEEMLAIRNTNREPGWKRISLNNLWFVTGEVDRVEHFTSIIIRHLAGHWASIPRHTLCLWRHQPDASICDRVDFGFVLHNICCNAPLTGPGEGHKV